MKINMMIKIHVNNIFFNLIVLKLVIIGKITKTKTKKKL